jgi:putative membrane protein
VDQLTDTRDPRIYFAAERTLLAWIRTGLAFMGFGFVVAKFGLFLTMINGGTASGHGASLIIGIALVLLGMITIAVSAVQHKRFVATLAAQDIPGGGSTRFPLFVAWCLAALGLLIAGYLAT